MIGAPRDETAFEFEPERGDSASELILDGVGEPSPELQAALAPYLSSRRVKLAGRAPAGSLLVLTRIDAVTQAYVVESPMGRLHALTGAVEPVMQASVARGSRWLAYRHDTGGNEDQQIFLLDMPRGDTIRLTDGRSRHGAFRFDATGTSLAYTSNARAEANMDVLAHPFDVPSPDGFFLPRQGTWVVLGWAPSGTELLVRRFQSVDVADIALVDLQTGDVTNIDPQRMDVNHQHASYAVSGRLYVASDRDRNHVGLQAVDLDTGTWNELVEDLPYDVEQFATAPTGTIALTTNEDGYSVLWTMGPDGESRRRIEEVAPGIVTGLRFLDAHTLAFAWESATAPADAYTLSLTTGALTRWTDSSSPDLDRTSLVSPSIERIPSFDDQQVPTLYYRPLGDGPFATILWFHGGPEEQTRPTYSPIIQFFVSQGFAVVAPNVRGSDGYGRTYRSLDNGIRRNHAVADVGAVLDWVAERPELDADRVGVHGASYGGYLVLASLVNFPERIRAGCDVVGISNFVTFLENTRPYRRDLRRVEYGDESDPDMRAFLQEASPLSKVERIRSALFVAHGANDPRVPVEEATQIVDAVRASGQPVWFMLAPDEGHGFRKRDNRDVFYRLLATFFDVHLRGDGQAQPSMSGAQSGRMASQPSFAPLPRTSR